MIPLLLKCVLHSNSVLTLVVTLSSIFYLIEDIILYIMLYFYIYLKYWILWKLLVKLFIISLRIFKFLRYGFCFPFLFWDWSLLCRLDWPSTCRDPFASASQELWFKVCDTKLSSSSGLIWSHIYPLPSIFLSISLYLWIEMSLYIFHVAFQSKINVMVAVLILVYSNL